MVRDEARKRRDAGLNAVYAALTIDMGEFKEWSDTEDIAFPLDIIYI
jgi:hypothetical protein